MSVAKRLCLVTAAVAGLVAPTLVATPANAAGGGCITNTQNSWNVGACSSDNGVTVFADAYVNRRGSLGSSCYVKYGIWDETSGRFVVTSDNQGCYVGRHPGIGASMASGHRYHNVTIVVVNGRTVWSGRSPTSY